MRAHTKTRHIEPNYEIDETPIKGEDVLKDIQATLNLPRWAINICGYRQREDLTQVKLAEKLGIKQSHISDMERGKRPIGKNLAKKLADFFHTDYKMFL